MQSWMIDTDINLGVDDQIIMDSLIHNDATRIGDIAIYELCAPTAAMPAPIRPAGTCAGAGFATTANPAAAGPDLIVEKAQTQTICFLNGTCIFDLWLTNRGPGIWSGIPRITDILPPGLTAVAAAPPWACEQVDVEVTCQYTPIDLDPSVTLTLSLTVQNSPGCAARGLQNCVQINPWPDDPLDPDPTNNAVCIPITIADRRRSTSRHSRRRARRPTRRLCRPTSWC